MCIFGIKIARAWANSVMMSCAWINLVLVFLLIRFNQEAMHPKSCNFQEPNTEQLNKVHSATIIQTFLPFNPP